MGKTYHGRRMLIQMVKKVYLLVFALIGTGPYEDYCQSYDNQHPS